MQQKLHSKFSNMSVQQRNHVKKALSDKLIETGHVSQAQAPITSEAIIKYLEGEEDMLIELVEHNPQMKVIIGEQVAAPIFAIVDGLVGEIPGAGGLIDGAAELGEQAGEIGAQGYALRKELQQQDAMLKAAQNAARGPLVPPAGTGKTVAQVAAPVIAATAAPPPPPPPPTVVAAVAGAPAAGTARGSSKSGSKPRSSGKHRKKTGKKRRKKKGNTKKGRRRRKRRGGHRTRRRGGRRTRGGRRRRSRRGGSFWKTWIKPDTCNSATDCPTDYPYCHIGRRRGMINFGLLSGHLGQCVR